MRTLLLLLILSVTGRSAGASAQLLPDTGSRVRVSDASGQVIIGTLQASSPDGMTILAEASGVSVLVPLESVRKFEWNYGKRRRFLKYFSIGTLSVAALTGTALALMTANENCRGEMFCSPGESFVLGAMMGTVIGTPVGVIAGLSAREDEWLPVPVPDADRLTFSFGLTGGKQGRVVAGLSVRSR